jgi:thiol-disulfide isomerase/thioredoxin
VKKFPTNLIYFRAGWNPACNLTDTHIRQFSEKYPIEIIRIDSDVSRKVA